MKRIRHLAAGAFLLLASLSAQGAELNCSGRTNVEEFRYSWRVRGGLRWIAGLVFPTSGTGNLKTIFPTQTQPSITSELLITAPNGRQGGFFEYESEMDASGQKTLMTFSGYSWGSKARKERAVFDYPEHVARIRKETPDKIETKVKPIPDHDMRDVLTAIYYLRQNASTIKRPIATSFYTDGKEYPVVFRPIGRKTFKMEGKQVSCLGFEIVDAPGGKDWAGGVKVWLSDDERRIPFRIEISQSIASLQLDLKSVESCAFMQAAK